MASLFNMPRPRGRRNEPDNLLGLNGDIGMTDSSFQGMGRAPVDELFAGRYSAAIDDDEFLEASEKAEAARQRAIDAKKDLYLNGPEFGKANREIDWQADTREYIYEKSGLDLYPGHLRADEEKPIYMQEFSDEGSRLTEDGWDQLVASSKSDDGEPVYLGDIFHHPELYRNYPEAQLLPVELNSQMSPLHRGSYFRPQGEGLGLMQLNPLITDEEKNRETLLHEIQHFIQSAEGWEGGGARSTQLGLDYATNLSDSGDTHTGRHESPSAQSLGDRVHEVYDETPGLMDFMKRENFGDAMAVPAYQGLSGEQLARDVTNRDAAGDAGNRIYYGATDNNEYANWNHTDASFKPMQSMPRIRQYMMDRGLLGPLMDEKGKAVAPHKTVDPYVEKYMQMMQDGAR